MAGGVGGGGPGVRPGRCGGERMAGFKVITKILATVLTVGLLVGWLPAAGLAQDQGAPPPSFSPDQLDKLVSRIALHPDPLLAQLLAAATFPDQIPDATKWADEHHYLTGDQLATAITEDHLPWD